MPKGKNQKFKLYRLAQIMLENTDEEHYITMPEIKEKLEEYEVTADRKSLYNDLKDLEKLGIEVEASRWKPLSLSCGRATIRTSGIKASGRCNPVFEIHHPKEDKYTD